ncbi:MAG: DUF1638 domain-containing protein [Verrucomicrobiales bacterium]|nr:DUF1638 domain-containing protein [Verrucomicrobiales bacterium]
MPESLSPAPARLLKVIACEIAFREICHCASRSPNLLDLEFVTQGLHDRPRHGGSRIQERIDAVPAGRYDAILLGYGLCGNLIRGLQARGTPLVVPRAHDCIALFLGSRGRHEELNRENPGCYYYTSGWLECLRKRGDDSASAASQYLASPAGMDAGQHEQYERWVEKYGEDKARFLAEQMGQWTAHYDTGALIAFDFAAPLRHDQQVRAICQRRGWRYRELQGNLGLLQRWLDGHWPEQEFVTIRPGERIVPTNDQEILKSAPTEPGPPYEPDRR